MTATLHDTLGQHHRHIAADGVVSCACGRWRSDSEATHSMHLDDVMVAWLNLHGYINAVGYITRGLTCSRCGAVIGSPDIHETACRSVD